MNALDQALDLLATELAERIAARVIEMQRGPAGSEWLDQHGSPLGARRHCAIARRRLTAGEPGASKLGRRWLLSSDALTAELAGATAPKQPAPRSEVRESLERKLRAVR